MIIISCIFTDIKKQKIDDQKIKTKMMKEIPKQICIMWIMVNRRLPESKNIPRREKKMNKRRIHFILGSYQSIKDQKFPNKMSKPMKRLLKDVGRFALENKINKRHAAVNLFLFPFSAVDFLYNYFSYHIPAFCRVKDHKRPEVNSKDVQNK